ncbi:hypothetical protein [Streptomyces graminilatus]|uniref:hypothetical protein n=1 Tax=Streptomyces graminilatus TaxID=1464070 RepID=UPI0006E3D360|nr:hypothetical protein [Streptomyces graminilatus]
MDIENMTSDRPIWTDSKRKAFYEAVSILGVLSDFYVKMIESPDTPADRHFMDSLTSDVARKFADDLLGWLMERDMYIVRE